MPALDIGDEAFDLLFYAYKKNRIKWLKDGEYRRTVKITDKNNKTRNNKEKQKNKKQNKNAETHKNHVLLKPKS